MSNRYKGGVISATPPTTTGGESGTASGAWTLEQQMQLQAAGLWPAQPTGPYIEELFSTYLYSGNSSTQTITNGINVSGKGGLVWIKSRTNATEHWLIQSVNTGWQLASNSSHEAYSNSAVTLGSAGFSLVNNSNVNESGQNYVSWTFREQPKFFDIVTYTGNGVFGREINHNLGAVPAVIIIKATSIAKDWLVYTTAIDGSQDYLFLNTDAVKADSSITTPWTSTTFPVGGSDFDNGNGITYVAYLFASNAGGFGVNNTDNVISCGSFTTPSSGNATITLGYEPQWLLVKSSSNTSDWYIVDTMRGLSQTSQSRLDANLAVSEEITSSPWFKVTSTGFTASSASIGGSRTFIYIAIRRGPMRIPTVGTTVFSPVARTGTGTITTVTAGFAPDLAISAKRTSGEYMPLADKLRGPTPTLFWQQGKTDAENSSYAGQWFTAFTNTGVIVGPDNGGGQAVNASGSSFIQYYFQRAPSFFDAVCYTGTGVAGLQVTHSLTVAPELLIVKARSINSEQWAVYASPITVLNVLQISTTIAATTYSEYWNNTAPTASVFSVGATSTVNQAGATYVAYLFATCPGVSKVGSYTGTGTLTTINCGFTGGARYVLIKRTDAVGNWVMWDTARGMVAGTDPSVSSNFQGAEINGDSVYTIATGFQLLASPTADVNTNGGTYIFLAIA